MTSSKDDEVLDLVNEQDEVIGEVLKVKANQDPSLWHREVAVLLFDTDNRLLLQQRSKKKIVQPGVWSVSCEGHVTKGMAIENAAHMELKEELGIDTRLLFIEKALLRAENETHFTNWFIGKYTGGEIVLEEEEVEQAAWFDKTEFRELIKSETACSKSLIEYGARFWNGEFSEFVNQL
ncbi:MAG: NUDIX domain-containing protein [Candidatus Andersenbacteria bacterium]